MKRRFRIGGLMIAIAIVALAIVLPRAVYSWTHPVHVQGEVRSPGLLRISGKETVLDALDVSGGSLVDPADAEVRLIRAPAADGKSPALRVDLDSIMKKGDQSTNYRLGPGDRIIVFREPRAPSMRPNDPGTRKVGPSRDVPLPKASGGASSTHPASDRYPLQTPGTRRLQ